MRLPEGPTKHAHAPASSRGGLPHASVFFACLASQLYIMTISVLAAYRRLSVGRKLLQRTLANVVEGKGELGDVAEVRRDGKD